MPRRSTRVKKAPQIPTFPNALWNVGASGAGQPDNAGNDRACRARSAITLQPRE